MKNNLMNISNLVIENIQKNSLFNYLIIFYCSFMICSPPYFITFVPTRIKTLFRLTGIFFILFIYFFYILQKKRISKLFVCTFVMCLYFLIICIINHNEFFYALYSNFFMALSAIALFEIYTNSRLKRYFVLINYYLWLISILIFIIVYIVNGQYFINMYNRNNYVIFYFIYLLFEKELLLFDSNKKYKTMSDVVLIVLIAFSIITGAATSSITLIVIFLYVKVFDIYFDKYKSKVFNHFSPYAIVLIIMFAVFVFPGSNSVVANIVSKLLHKVKGLSGRDVIYDADRVLFFQRPIFGYGSYGDYTELIGRQNAHSIIFQYLIDGGIVGLLLLINCYRITINTIKRKLDLNLICYLLMFLFAFTMRNIFEAIGLNYILFVLSQIYFMSSTEINDYIELSFL